MAVKNRVASVLCRLKQQAMEEGISFQMILQLFCQEEFLRRLANSPYAENFVLKGGMFIYTLTGFDSRATKDIDFLARRLSNDLVGTENIMKEICEKPTENDYIRLEVLGVERITADKKYPGVKIKYVGFIGNVRAHFSIDVGVDDRIVPGAIKRRITTRLPDFLAPEIFTYSLESTIAEKLDAILQRMETTSRMKDFYDIYYLSSFYDFNGKTLHEAIRATLEHRERQLDPCAFERIVKFNDNKFLSVQWKAFEPGIKEELAFNETLERIRIFLGPVYDSILNGRNFDLEWNCEAKEWR